MANPKKNRPQKPPKSCGCTGVRWCRGCIDPVVRDSYKMDPPQALPQLLKTRPDAATSRSFEFDVTRQSVDGCPDFQGVFVVPDFVSAEDARSLLEAIDASAWHPAQSGKRKQHYGAKVNFNKKRINLDKFHGLPAYAYDFEAQLKARFETEIRTQSRHNPDSGLARVCDAIRDFRTTDLFVLRYSEEQASNLDLHLDDVFAYGEVIFDVSLESDCVMTFYRRTDHDEYVVRVPIGAGSALVLTGAARLEWEHGILAYDIQGQRTSLTFRTLSAAVHGTDTGQDLLRIAAERLT